MEPDNYWLEWCLTKWRLELGALDLALGPERGRLVNITNDAEPIEDKADCPNSVSKS